MAIFCNILVAFALLRGEPVIDLNNQATIDAQFASLRLSLQYAAAELEILDPREMRYVLTSPKDFANDVKMLQYRYRDLLNCPPVIDSIRFPERNELNNMLVFNREYYAYLQDTDVSAGNHNRVSDVMAETDFLYHVYDAIRDAKTEYFYVTIRRQALRRLRELIGDDAYFQCKLPPHVPIWRFHLIK